MNAKTMDRLISALLMHEGFDGQMYLDPKGNVTVGIGELIPSVSAAARIPFLDAHANPLAPDAVIAEFDRVVAIGQSSNIPYRRASYYAASPPNAYLPIATACQRAEARVQDEFIPGVRALLADFDVYPDTVQSALLDMAWNLGLGGLAKFGNLLACCRARDWEVATNECHRSTCSAGRNAWTAQMFADAAGDTRSVA